MAQAFLDRTIADAYNKVVARTLASHDNMRRVGRGMGDLARYRYRRTAWL